MKKEIKIIVSIAIIVILILFGIIIGNKNHTEVEEYGNIKVTTDYKWKTMRNDGGSHTNIYYQIDLQNKKVTKLEDEYKGFEGYIYQGKVLYTKELTDREIRKLNIVFEKLNSYIATDIEKKEANYSSYIFEGITSETIEVYNQEIIEEFSKIVE